MSGETGSSKEEAMNEQLNTEAHDPAEVREMLKHPPAIDDVMRGLSPEELLSNPTMAPEMLNEGEGLRDDLRRDD